MNQEDRLKELVTRMNKLLDYVGGGASVHTFQYVAISDEAVDGSVLTWRTLSKDADGYADAVAAFIRYDEARKTVYRTLINDEWDSGPYWHGRVPGNGANITENGYAYREADEAVHKLGRSDGSDSVDEKLSCWIKCLEMVASEDASALWVSQTLRQRGTKLSVAAFVLVEPVLTSPMALYQIAKTSRDFLIDRSVAWYEQVLEKAHSIQRNAFRNLLGVVGAEDLVGDRALTKLQEFEPFLLAGLPLTVLGPPGTGKTRLAWAAHRLAHAGTSPLPPFEVYHASKLNMWARSADTTRIADAEGTVVCLNIHRLAEEVYDYLHTQVVDSILNPKLFLICTADPALYDERVPEEVRVELNTVLLRLDGLANRGEELERLSVKMLNHIARTYKGEVKSLSNSVVEQLAKQQWPRNDGELYGTLLRSYFINKSDVIERLSLEWGG